MLRAVTVSFAAFLVTATAAAAMASSSSFRLHKVVSSHMVLQADNPSIFGFGTSGDVITAELGSVTKHATVSAAGKWLVELDPQPASFTPVNITVTNGVHTIVSDILFGDVWICR